MEYYVGLDVSLKQTAICIVDRTGKVQREGIVSSDPEAITTFIKSYAQDVVRIGLESGPWRRGCGPNCVSRGCPSSASMPGTRRRS
jgi:predicted NBD/HSP70 family sugar kinase